jgi:hypothetical protein
VNHKAIWPLEALSGLPTYNSMAIETNMHRIEGLAEHFVYANDDMLFLEPLEPKDFYDEQDGYETPYVLIAPRGNTSTNLDLKSGGQEFVIAHNQAVAASRAGRVADAEALFASAEALYPHPWHANPTRPGTLILNHMPYILRKGFVLEAQSKWPESYSNISFLPCRGSQHSPVWTYNWFNVLHNNAKPSPRIYARQGSLAFGAARNYGFMQAHDDGYHVPCAEATGDVDRIAEWFRHTREAKPMVICLEDDLAQDCPIADRTSEYAKQAAIYRKFFLEVTPDRSRHFVMSQCRACTDGLQEC